MDTSTIIATALCTIPTERITSPGLFKTATFYQSTIWIDGTVHGHDRFNDIKDSYGIFSPVLFIAGGSTDDVSCIIENTGNVDGFEWWVYTIPMDNMLYFI